MHLGPGEIALLVVLALVLFGAKRLPQVGRAAGEAIREFKSAFSTNAKNDAQTTADAQVITDGTSSDGTSADSAPAGSSSTDSENNKNAGGKNA